MKLTEALREADRIGLIGSCLAREVKELACSTEVHANYIWRSNTISMMSDPVHRQIDMAWRACRAVSRRPCAAISTRPILRPFWPVIRWC